MADEFLIQTKHSNGKLATVKIVFPCFSLSKVSEMGIFRGHVITNV